ncbi:MAG: SAM-dependent methyltransferase [Planctomycetales bacterium]
MTIAGEIEAARLLEQERLDARKSASERNKWGQFATPPELALEIARLAWNRLRRRKGDFRFLDPAIGTGSFFSAATQAFPADRLRHAAGVELDPEFAAAADCLWKGHGLDVIQGDFTKQSPPGEKFDLLLANPPYVRHHHLAAKEKTRLRRLARDRVGIEPSGLAGLYCHFLLLADAWLAPKGLSAWLIPSEFMDVNYGQAIKTYLLDHVKLIRVHRFCPTEPRFRDALVSSAVVVFEKSTPGKNHDATFSFGGSLASPRITRQVTNEESRRVRKWTTLPEQHGGSPEQHGDQPSCVSLGDLFHVKRGLATGNNGFFVLPRGRAKSLGIPSQFLRPILPSPRHVRQEVIAGDRQGHAALEPQLTLIDCPLGEEALRAKHPDFWTYLEQGMTDGVHQGYLASRRVPWYSQESREPAPFLCTYMGRSRERPFRFIWNQSQATAANVYLLLYPQGELKTLLADRPELLETLFDALREIEASDFIRQGRVYGGGLHKLEPAELKRLPADRIAQAVGLRVESA